MNRIPMDVVFVTTGEKGQPDYKITHMSIELRDEQAIKNMQDICRRAGNCWDRASPEIKEFIDTVTDSPTQDYYSMEGVKPRTTEVKPT